MDCPWYIVATHRYPWTVHGTLYPRIYPWTVHGTLYLRMSMDCPWYIVSTDIHGLSMVHCIHRYPWTVHGTLYPQISMDCPWYIVSTDIHGLSMVHCIHRCPWTVPHHISTDIHEKLLMYPWISMDCPRTPWGRWLEKLLGNTNVSMDIHGLSAHPMGRWLEKLLGNTMYPWISMDCPRTPWGRWLEKLLGNTMYPWISMDCRAPHGGDGWKSYSGIQCVHGYPWISMYCPRTPWGEMAAREYIVSMDPSFHGLSTHPMGELLIPWISVLPDLWI